MVLIRSALKTTSYSVRARIYPLEKITSLKQSKTWKRQVCTDVTKPCTFSSIVRVEILQINHKVNFE